jgi:hypothetical protein
VHFHESLQKILVSRPWILHRKNEKENNPRQNDEADKKRNNQIQSLSQDRSSLQSRLAPVVSVFCGNRADKMKIAQKNRITISNYLITRTTLARRL